MKVNRLVSLPPKGVPPEFRGNSFDFTGYWDNQWSWRYLQKPSYFNASGWTIKGVLIGDSQNHQNYLFLVIMNILRWGIPWFGASPCFAADLFTDPANLVSKQPALPWHRMWGARWIQSFATPQHVWGWFGIEVDEVGNSMDQQPWSFWTWNPASVGTQ